MTPIELANAIAPHIATATTTEEAHHHAAKIHICHGALFLRRQGGRLEISGT